MCSYLGLESLDLLPPLKTCAYVTSVSIPTIDGAFNKTIATMSERLLTPMTHGPAQPNLIENKTTSFFCSLPTKKETHTDPVTSNFVTKQIFTSNPPTPKQTL
jgi:hypothetical protein